MPSPAPFTIMQSHTFPVLYHVLIQHPDGTVVYAEPRMSGYGTSDKPYLLRFNEANRILQGWAPRAYPKSTATMVRADVEILPPPPPELAYRTITRTEILARIGDFRTLTSDSPSSDMNQLLDSLEKGGDPLIAAIAAYDGDCPVGWASCEAYMRRSGSFPHYVLGCFVAPRMRYLGVGAQLANGLIGEVRRTHPTVDLATGKCDSAFWSHFTLTTQDPLPVVP